MKDELDGKVMKDYSALRAKHIANSNNEDKKAKGTKSIPEKENLNLKIIDIS